MPAWDAVVLGATKTTTLLGTTGLQNHVILHKDYLASKNQSYNSSNTHTSLPKQRPIRHRLRWRLVRRCSHNGQATRLENNKSYIPMIAVSAAGRAGVPMHARYILT